VTLEPFSVGDIARFRRGDHGTFRKVVERYSPRLMAVVTSYASDADEARDLLQEVWFRAFRKRRQFAARGSLIGWLFSICRSVCLDSTAKRHTRERLVLETPRRDFPVTEDATYRSELRRGLHEALSALPAREREVAIMRLIEGRSTRETAEQLECAEGTVKAALHHAIAKLKSSMEVWVS